MFRKVRGTKLNPALARQLLKLTNQLSANQSQGFTLLEVLVSIILLTAFMSVTMATLATATLVKVRSNGLTVATNWIEEDLEAVRSQAAVLAADPTKCNATSSSSGFSQALADQLQRALPDVNTTRDGTQRTPDDVPEVASNYTLTRQASITATAPFEVLQLTYTVTDSENRSNVTTMYTEVIPNAAFQCQRF
jgi:prepilin-type N-terminal cleavage/methylation domain-containing protein